MIYKSLKMLQWNRVGWFPKDTEQQIQLSNALWKYLFIICLELFKLKAENNIRYFRLFLIGMNCTLDFARLLNGIPTLYVELTISIHIWIYSYLVQLFWDVALKFCDTYLHFRNGYHDNGAIKIYSSGGKPLSLHKVLNFR